MNLLEINNLSVKYRIGSKWLQAVNDINLALKEGESLGIIGESGCGKSTLLMAISCLLPPNAVINGNCKLKGRNIFAINDDELRKIRWADMANVFQGAMNSLNPVLKIGDLMAEAFLHHEPLATNAEVETRIHNVLQIVDLPLRVKSSYAHELSGGMRQRVNIALALVCNPSLLLADEPTTALDVLVQDGIIGQILKLQKQLHFGLILVSHDVSVVSETCDRVAIMYGGRIVESGMTYDVFSNPLHPYTLGLMQSFLALDAEHKRLISIPGTPPKLIDPPKGCPFEPRCPLSDKDLCLKMRPCGNCEGSHEVFCHYSFSEIKPKRLFLEKKITFNERVAEKSEEPFLLLKNLKKSYKSHKKNFSLKEEKGSQINAIDDVSIHFENNSIVAIVGESGSGKTTLGKILCRLEQPTSGNIEFRGQNLFKIPKAFDKQLTQEIQMIFQDPFESLDPRFTVEMTVSEPLLAHSFKNKTIIQQKISQALIDVGLSPIDRYLNRKPHELSGGERQRVAIARAIVLNPALIIADEPVSMLDVSIRAGILNLLVYLKEKIGSSVLLITHDLAVARYLAERLIVLYGGKVMEEGPTEEVLSNPKHPYTSVLLAASPRFKPGRKRQIGNNPPQAIQNSKGCVFAPKCPMAQEECFVKRTSLQEVKEGHRTSCFILSKNTF